MRKKIRKLLLFEAGYKTKEEKRLILQSLDLANSSPGVSYKEIKETDLCKGCYLK